MLLGGSLSWSLWGVVAECKIRTKGSSRILDKDGKYAEDLKQPRFKKRKFLKLLWPDFWYLVAAVVVSRFCLFYILTKKDLLRKNLMKSVLTLFGLYHRTKLLLAYQQTSVKFIYVDYLGVCDTGNK